MDSSSQKRDDYKYLYKFEKGTSTFIDNSQSYSSFAPMLTPFHAIDPAHIINKQEEVNMKTKEEEEEEEEEEDNKESNKEDNTQEDDTPSPTDNIKSSPPFIIDPMSLMTKLAILGKKPIHTKISLVNHCITIHEPGIFQGIVRYYNKSTKQDLHYLQIPIETACMQYIILPTYVEYRDRMICLFKNAALGLQNLASTYKQDSMVVLCINHYINIIHNAISMNSIIMSNDVDNLRKYYNDVFMNEMKNIWKADKMDIVLRLAESLEDTSIRSLEIFMEGIDNDIMSLLVEKTERLC